MRLAEKRREQVIDLLSERLAFERSSARLYDRIIETLRPSSAAASRDLLVTMQKHRAEEDEHARWLEERIRELGGDGGAGGDLAEVVTRESRGIEGVVEDDAADVRHLLHALLAAEAVDHAGWDLLVHLAGDRESHRELAARLQHEKEHLAAVREALERHAIRTLFGEDWAEEHAADLAPSAP
jgi:ferritin-like protein